MEKLEGEVKALHGSLEQVQATLTSPELARLSLKEQLTQRQVTCACFGPQLCFCLIIFTSHTKNSFQNRNIEMQRDRDINRSHQHKHCGLLIS